MNENFGAAKHEIFRAHACVRKSKVFCPPKFVNVALKLRARTTLAKCLSESSRKNVTRETIKAEPFAESLPAWGTVWA